MEKTLNKVSVVQTGLSHRCLPFSFPNTFLRLFPNSEQICIPLNDNIAWCKNLRVIKDLSNIGSLFLIGVPST